MGYKKNSGLTLPGAIIIAAALIGIAIIWTHRPASTPETTKTKAMMPSDGSAGIPAVTSADHILGNPIAPVKLVEYSDPSCPFCKLYNQTMEDLIAKYGPAGQVAWVYRHFPLNQPDSNGNVLHPHAGRQAEAFECAAALGGNNVFWAYEKQWFSVFPEDGANRADAVDNKQIADTAKAVGLDPVSFNDCLASGRFKDKIEQAYIAGINVGVTGTPYTVIITPSGTQIVREGADSYGTLKSVIDTLLVGGTTSTK